MTEKALRELLEAIRAGKVDVDEAIASLRRMPFEPLGFANVDHHRSIRCGAPEVIFCQGKTAAQVVEIFSRLAESGVDVLATRADDATAKAVTARFPQARHEAVARTISLVADGDREAIGHVAIVAAGTSDIPVAEEARVTAGMLGANVTTHYDVGVAGLHRLLAQSARLQSARAIVAVAGMEGALASVVGGLVAVPVVAVPTSIGYGASFGGLAALLAMLNSCASNVSVVNIDNGFSAGYIAALINRQGQGEPADE
ncbi:MAG: nickel pincer cofactor biosynthesis protein LarB [Planctomycetes bacterium]|nr:nickel pincer cofactor biosynthesis protein LarB [Planctomycetota bacterium]